MGHSVFELCNGRLGQSATCSWSSKYWPDKTGTRCHKIIINKMCITHAEELSQGKRVRRDQTLTPQKNF